MMNIQHSDRLLVFTVLNFERLGLSIFNTQMSNYPYRFGRCQARSLTRANPTQEQDTSIFPNLNLWFITEASFGKARGKFFSNMETVYILGRKFRSKVNIILPAKQ